MISKDFSDSVATMRLKRGYKAAEIYESEPTEEETFERKYSRICLEVKELLAEVEKVKLPTYYRYNFFLLGSELNQIPKGRNR
jgi:hypothetical protein